MTIILLILTFALLVIVHEWGHFIKAKRSGVRVDEFGFGFPPRLFGIKKGETLYSLNLIPLGGFVRIHGEDGSDKSDPRSFGSKSIFQRFGILSSGVAMNFVLAIILLIIVNMTGVPQAVDEHNENLVSDKRIQIVAISKGSPAEQAGLRLADTIKAIKIDSNVIGLNNIEELQENTNKNLGKELGLIIERGGVEQEINLLARKDYPENEGPLGIALIKTGLYSYPWWEAVWRGIAASFQILFLIVAGIIIFVKNLVLGSGVSGDVAGPLGIGFLTVQMISMGFSYWLQFTALLSINLAFINILPFPALDGGRIVFLIIEKIKGAPVNARIEKWVHATGFLVLMLLILIITFRDIEKFF